MPEFSDSKDYLLEKFAAGVSILATHPGRIRERLEDAYASQVMRGDRPGQDLPQELRVRIEKLHDRMTTAADVGGIGTIAATVHAMSEDEAGKIAQEICAIEAELNELVWSKQ